MGDPLNKSGSQPHRPVTRSDVAKTQKISGNSTKFKRTVSIVEAAPQMGLRARAKNFLPRPLYKFLVSLVSSNNKAQYELGKAISQTQKDSAEAWQTLGQYHALPPSEQDSKIMFELQLSCRQKDLKLDLLLGWGDSPVTLEKQRVIHLLEQCVESPDDKSLVKVYEDACAQLRRVEHDQETLSLRRARLESEAESLAPKLIEEQNPETEVLQQEKAVFDDLKIIKKKLAVIDADIKRYENSQVDDESARDAVFYYESVEKAREKGER